MLAIFEMEKGYEVLVPELHSFLKSNKFKEIVERFGTVKKLKEYKKSKNVPKGFQKADSNKEYYYFRKKTPKTLNLNTICPECGNHVKFQEGCHYCVYCGWSACG